MYVIDLFVGIQPNSHCIILCVETNQEVYDAKQQSYVSWLVL